MQLPFSLDRENRRPLSAQMFEGVRQAIVDGFWKPGDALPTWAEWADALDVSMRVPREAMSRLAAEGWINVRTRVGSTVLCHKSREWSGRVAIVISEQYGFSFYAATLINKMRAAITGAGFAVTIVYCKRCRLSGKDDLSEVEALLRRPMDLIVSMIGIGPWRRISVTELPPILFLGDAPRRKWNGCGQISIDLNLATSDFVSHCVAKRIKRVLEVGMRGTDGVQSVGRLRYRGIEAERLQVPFSPGSGFFENLIESAMMTLGHYLDLHRGKLPSVILLADDYIAIGALTAILHRRIRVPRDVRLVTFANKGFGPVFPCKLTRLEMDAESDGEHVGGLIAEYLKGGPMPDGVRLGPHYRVGESF